MKKRHVTIGAVLLLSLLFFGMLFLFSCGKCRHDWGEWETLKAATCRQMGTKRRTCSLCGLTETDVEGLVPHRYEWVTDVEPTETEEGLRHEECVVCHAIRQENVPIPKTEHVHTFVHMLPLAATCTTAGHGEYWYCTGCYGYFVGVPKSIRQVKRKDVDLPPLGHLFTNYVSNGDATSTEDGTKTAVCDREGCTATETVTDSGTRLTVYYTVTFYGYDGVTVWKTEKVPAGDSATPPDVPSDDVHIFVGWEGVYTNVMADSAVYAMAKNLPNVFTVSPATVKKGETVEITVRLGGAVRLCGFDMRLFYDARVLELVAVRKSGQGDIVAGAATDGEVRFNAMAPDGEEITAETEILTLTFRAVGDTGKTVIRLSAVNCLVWSASGRPTSTDYRLVDGVVAVTDLE